MPSKLITDRQKSAESVIAVAEAHTVATAKGIELRLKPFLKKGEAVPDIETLMHLCARALEAAKDRMVEADAAHEAELGDDAAVRDARDAASNGLYTRLVELREVLIGVYGSDIAGKVFNGSTPEDAVVLERYAGEVADRLGKIKLPAPRVKGAKLDPGEIADGLGEQRGELKKQLKAVQREIREAQATLAAKNAELVAYDEGFASIATIFTGLLRLGGQRDLAAKVKPSMRRPGQTAEAAGDVAEPAAAPSGP